IVHPLLAAEISDRTEAGIDPHSGADGSLKTNKMPFGFELCDALLHFDCHCHACLGVFGDTPGFRIAEKGDNRVAYILVERRSMFKRNARHLVEVPVENVSELFGFKIFRCLCEADKVGEKNCQLLAGGGDLNLLTAVEDRGVEYLESLFESVSSCSVR